MRYKKKKLLLLAITIFLMTIISTNAQILENNVRVAENTELIYYLDVTYDGIDINSVESSDNNLAEVNSGYINVEDKLPEGLTFTGFVKTEDGTIGAVNRSDGKACVGSVVDDSKSETLTDYHGLHYDEMTRKISFRVRNLQAGCKLTVGVKTLTPTIDDPTTIEKEVRRDFYNTATATEDTKSVVSETVHAWMGNEQVDLYDVEYQYEGDIPKNAPSTPESSHYVASTKVGVEKDATLQGYSFSGWESDDVQIKQGTFIMPNKNVVLKGSFTEEPKYKVQYRLNGEMPVGYVLPKTKSYAQNTVVNVDGLAIGTIIDGYRFLGWKTEDVIISQDNDFKMPSNDIIITGEFEVVTYNVEYRFQGNNLPTNYQELLPEIKSYRPNDTVTLADYPVLPGYRFLGWYKEDKFKMPAEDVIIYGEWALENGVFEPTITKEIVDNKKQYKVGDTVQYKITVTNTADYPITEVVIHETNEKAKFLTDEYYSVLSDQMVKIDSINPHETINLYAIYEVTSEDAGTITNEVELVGALASNNYNLNKDREYKASASFEVSKDEPIVPNTNDNIIKYIIMFITTILITFSIIIVYKKQKENKHC